MKQKKKIWLVTLAFAIAFALVLFAGCTRTGYNYYPGQFVAQDINYNSGQFVPVDNNDNNPAPFVSQAHNYYFGPYVSVVTGTLTSKTIITTERRGNSAAYVYMLNIANPINISKVNIPNDSDVITANNVTAFELAVCNMNLSAYLGSQVRVTGQFSLRDCGNDSTRVVMDASKLEIYNTAPVSQCPPPIQCPPPQKIGTYRIQVGAYCSPANANIVMTRLQRQNLCPIKENYLQYTRVALCGIPANRLDNTVAAVRRAGFDDPLIQRE